MLTEEATETEIINEEKFIDNMELIVGTKTESQVNTDEDDDNDEYNVGFKFSLVVQPDKDNDDLIVKILDANGVVAKEARIAGQKADGETMDYLVPQTDENGVYYLLEGMQLTENTDTQFNLKLEGTQYLTEGVYVFESEKKTLAENFQDKYEYWTQEARWPDEQSWAYGELKKANKLPEGVEKKEDLTKEMYKEAIGFLYGYEKEKYMKEDGTIDMDYVTSSQNFIGYFEGEAEVSTSMSINMTFNVEESTVTTTREWREEHFTSRNDDDDDDEEKKKEEKPEEPVVTPDEPVIELPEPEVPLAEISEADVPLAEIPEENVPLAEIPEVDVPMEEAPELVEMPESEVPLADVPKTGDSVAAYVMMGLSAMLLVGLGFTGRKEKN